MLLLDSLSPEGSYSWVNYSSRRTQLSMQWALWRWSRLAESWLCYMMWKKAVLGFEPMTYGAESECAIPTTPQPLTSHYPMIPSFIINIGWSMTFNWVVTHITDFAGGWWLHPCLPESSDHQAIVLLGRNKLGKPQNINNYKLTKFKFAENRPGQFFDTKMYGPPGRPARTDLSYPYIKGGISFEYLIEA